MSADTTAQQPPEQHQQGTTRKSTHTGSEKSHVLFEPSMCTLLSTVRHHLWTHTTLLYSCRQREAAPGAARGTKPAVSWEHGQLVLQQNELAPSNSHFSKRENKPCTAGFALHDGKSQFQFVREARIVCRQEGSREGSAYHWNLWKQSRFWEQLWKLPSFSGSVFPVFLTDRRSST